MYLHTYIYVQYIHTNLCVCVCTPRVTTSRLHIIWHHFQLSATYSISDLCIFVLHMFSLSFWSRIFAWYAPGTFTFIILFIQRWKRPGPKVPRLTVSETDKLWARGNHSAIWDKKVHFALWTSGNRTSLEEYQHCLRG